MSKEFGKILKYLREKNELLQIELAQELNTSTSVISNWENGKFEPSIDQLKFLADYFNVSIDYLIGYTNTNQNELEQKLKEAKKLAKELQKYYHEAEQKTFEWFENKNKKKEDN